MRELILIIVAIWLPLTEQAENQYRFAGKSTIAVEGTSTLHDWTMETNRIDGVAAIEVADDQTLSIQQLQVKIPVESLKSGRNKLDDNAYDALKSNRYPQITFDLKGFDNISLSNGREALEVRGDLTIAGETRQEKILVEYRTDAQGNLYVSGSKDIKMTDYGVTPPEVMLGTIKTGNEITILLDLYLARN